MTEYHAPLRDMHFVLDELAGMAEITGLPGYEEATPDLIEAILGEANKLASEVLAPLNQVGDRERLTFENGVVRMPPGFTEAYARFVEGGWGSLAADPDYGGQGLPWTLAIAVQEMWNAANLSFALGPMLTQGVVAALQVHGTGEQKATYLPKLVSGEWAGTMNLTASHAGTDVGALKTRAVPEGDHYLIQGQKIFITWGEHDCAENIVHMVLARTPDAPPGTKGLSLFIVPKFLPRPDGTPGQRNDLRCVSLEEKLGIHASPTCVMAYGDSGGAIGYLMGEENGGMACMFTMMNNARVLIGLEGLALGERAYQAARDYARERIQGSALGERGGGPVPIIRHPDVRRMLMTMKVMTQATRAICYDCAFSLDMARAAASGEEREMHSRRGAYLTPIAKAFGTDTGCEVAHLGVQVHGGMGYIEETGAAQHFRDARIAPIYEGTNGIQAADLVGRKVLKDNGAGVEEFLDELDSFINGMATISKDNKALTIIRKNLARASDLLNQATDWILEEAKKDMVGVMSASTNYQALFGYTAGGWVMARSAVAAQTQIDDGNEDKFYQAKIATALFFAEEILPRALSLGSIVEQSHNGLKDFPISQF